MPINHILVNCPWINLLIWVPDYMKEFAKHVLPDNAIVRNYTEAQTKYDDEKTGITTKWLGQHTPMKCNAVDYSYHVLCDIVPTIEQKSFLKIRKEEIDLSSFDLPENYVVLQGAYTEKVKTMPLDTFNKINQFIIKKGYIPVYLGKTENQTGVKDIVSTAKVLDDYNFENGINLINKTSLLQSAAIMDGAKACVIMDGGLLHLGGFTEAEMICGVTFVNKEQVAPIRNNKQMYKLHFVESDESLGCRGCQSNWHLFYNHDFRECFYKDYTCVKMMTAQKFIDILKKII